MRAISGWMVLGPTAIVSPPFLRLQNRKPVIPSFRWFWSLAAALTLCALATGCVQRRLTIRTTPPGALVYIGNLEIGKTPCSVSYLWYGVREIKIIKDGYETLTVHQWIGPPWYEIPPIDFVSENFVPYELRDERTLQFQLIPQRVVPNDQLLGRAEVLRQSNRLQNMTAPQPVVVAPATVPPGTPLPAAPAGMPLPATMPPPAAMPPGGRWPFLRRLFPERPPATYPTFGPQPPPGPR